MIIPAVCASRRRSGAAEFLPPWSSVVSLLHLNGANGSTAITDETGRIWTANGGAVIDTSKSVFGGASARLQGDGYLLHAPDTAHNFGFGAFTVEARVCIATHAQQWGAIISNGGSFYMDALYLSYFGDNSPAAQLRRRFVFGGHNVPTSSGDYQESGNPYLASSDPVELDRWYTVAVSRDSSNNLRLFVDGVLQQVKTAGGYINFSRGEGTRIGRNGWDGANGQFNGWVDEVRMVAGYARTSNYSPATSEFPNS